MRGTPLLALALFGCGPDVTLEILAPAPGEVPGSGQPVTLSAEATVDGVPVDVSPTWTAPDWTADGNDLTVNDLPEGAYDLVASAVIEGVPVEAAVAVDVVPVPVDYEGDTAIKVDIDSPEYGAHTLDCTHEHLSFTVQPDGALSGSGACKAFQTWEFTITGTVDGDDVSGEMAMSGQEDTLSFEGTRSADATVQVAFDHTWAEGEGSLRLYGTFTAAPVEVLP